MQARNKYHSKEAKWVSLNICNKTEIPFFELGFNPKGCNPIETKNTNLGSYDKRLGVALTLLLMKNFNAEQKMLCLVLALLLLWFQS